MAYENIPMQINRNNSVAVVQRKKNFQYFCLLAGIKHFIEKNFIIYHNM